MSQFLFGFLLGMRSKQPTQAQHYGAPAPASAPSTYYIAGPSHMHPPLERAGVEYAKRHPYAFDDSGELYVTSDQLWDADCLTHREWTSYQSPRCVLVRRNHQGDLAAWVVAR